LDAEVLLAHALGVDRSALWIDRSLQVSGPAVHAFQNAIRRRAIEREPLAYITGKRHFMQLEVGVDRRVLIPRPETELLVEVALGLEHGVRVLDMCTGSGAVALALKHARPDLELMASDISPAALEVARANARATSLDVAFLKADLLDGVPAVDAVVCNPPYVARGERLQPEIARHEPALALDGGADGMQVARRAIAQVGASGARWLGLELGAGQAEPLAELALQSNFARVQLERDLAGIERVLVAQR
jgi:release factor glutamine methyltransferase